MESDSMLKAYIMKAAAHEELSFSEDDIVPLEFCAKTDMAAGVYYNIQYVIFERSSKNSIWKCESLVDGRCRFEIMYVKENHDATMSLIDSNLS